MVRSTMLLYLLLVGSLCKVNAQYKGVYPKDKLVSIHLDNVAIKEVLDSIQAQTKITYSDRYELLRRGTKVSIHVDSIAVSAVLKEISQDQVFDVGIIWTIHVRLKPAMREKLRTGYVVDEQGRPVYGVTVAYKAIGLADFTTEKGSFYFNKVEPGTTLEVYGRGVKDKII